MGRFDCGQLLKMINCIVLLITFLSLQCADGIATKRSYEDPSPIKYPGPMQELSNKYGLSDDSDGGVPDECKGKQFCTIKPSNYPQAKFNEMFKGYKPTQQPTLVVDESLDNRQGDDSTDGCETIISYEPLYQVRSKAGNWRTVIQAPDENFVQKVRLEECMDTKSSCFTVFPSQPGVETFCKQKYNVWEVLVAPGNGVDKPEKIRTELPVCCSCNYMLN